LLNKAIEMELGASISYMWQSVILEQTANPSLKETFKESSINKLKRAMDLGGRLYTLEGIPTTQTSLENIGNSLKEMIEFDLKAEKDITSIFKDILQKQPSKAIRTHVYFARKFLTKRNN